MLKSFAKMYAIKFLGMGLYRIFNEGGISPFCASIKISLSVLPVSASFKISEISVITVSPGETFLIFTNPHFLSALKSVSKLWR